MKNTTLCYIEHENKYLMLYRNKKKNDPNSGKWIGVGGKIEPGETPEQAMLREVFEETGINLEKWKFRGRVFFVSDLWEDEVMHLYTANTESDFFQPCDEGELSWIDKDKILQLSLWEGDRFFLELLQRDEPEFELRLEYTGDKLNKAILNN